MNTPYNDGGQAFPRPVSFSEEGGTHRGCLGMTLRDYFAGQALAGMLSNSSTRGAAFYAECSYTQADAMLASRERKEDAP